MLQMDASGVNFPTSSGSESLGRLTWLMECSEPVRGMISEFVGPVDPNKRLRVYVCVMTNLNILLSSYMSFIFPQVFVLDLLELYSQQKIFETRLGSSSSAIVIEFSPTWRCFCGVRYVYPPLKFNNSPLNSYRSHPIGKDPSSNHHFLRGKL